MILREERFLIAGAAMLIGIVMVLWVSGCAVHDDLEPSEKMYVVKQVVQDDWCYLHDEAVYGWTKVFPTHYEICVSLESDMPSRTLDHELRHVALHTLGLDMTVIDW